MAVPVLEFRPTVTPEPTAVLASQREVQLSRLLMAWVSVGLLFMLLPGTFLGVWNLISISGRQAADSVSPAWIQAHGPAQIFGWIGSFILGIGFYSLPKLLRGRPFQLRRAWTCYALWTSGVALRWTANVYAWHWRLMLPLSAAFEILAFSIFFHAVTGHRAGDGEGKRFESWIWVVIAATAGLFLTLAVNLGACIYLSLRSDSPAFPHSFDQRYLVLMTWGFLVPFVWGFSARWLPVFLGLKPLRTRVLAGAVALNGVGVVAALAGEMLVSAVLLLSGAATVFAALRLFEPIEREAKTRGVHASFPLFVRSAYVWMMIAAVLGIRATLSINASGVWGASRHALTVGFFATMVFGVGQRILPAFSGMRHLYSTKLMFACMALLTIGCALRVSAEILAYQGVVAGAWSWLPVSAVTELMAVTLFAANLLISFARPAPRVVCS